MSDIPGLLILIFSPGLKGLDQLSITSLTTSASTYWAIKPTIVINREELVSRAALNAFVVVRRPLMQIRVTIDKNTFNMPRRNLIRICSLRFRIILNILLKTNVSILHRTAMTVILVNDSSASTSSLLSLPLYQSNTEAGD